MHKFLRAVGLSDIKKEELEKICKDIEEKPDTIKVAEDSEGNEFAELCHQFGDFFGLTLRGTYREDDTFEMDYKRIKKIYESGGRCYFRCAFYRRKNFACNE